MAIRRNEGVADDADDDGGRTQRSVQSVEVGGRLLLALAANPVPMGLKDLAAKSGLSAARAHPYLVSYIKLGLIERDSASQRYALGPAALQIGLACLYQLDVTKASAPVAEELAASTGRAVFVAVWANFGPTVVRMIEGSQPLHVSMRVGTVMSILGSATGRAYAASLPLAKLEQAMTRPIGGDSNAAVAFTADMQKIVEDSVDELAKHGVIRAVGRPIPSVNAFSAPAFNHEGEAVVVITAMGHEDTVPANWNSALAKSVRKAAADISARLGYRAPPARYAA